MNKILIAEDEPHALEALEKQLKSIVRAGTLIVSAANGAQALRESEKFIPDLAILDIEMPVLNGIEAAKMIKRIHPACRIVFLTAYQSFDYAVSALRVPASDYILKPVQTDVLREKLLALYPELSQHVPPEEEKGSPFKVKAACYIDAHYCENISLDSMAEVFSLNPFYFSHLFKEEFGQTFIDYLTAYRLQKAKNLLTGSDLSVKEIAHKCGYTDANYFAKVYKRKYAKNPGESRKSKKITP